MQLPVWLFVLLFCLAVHRVTNFIARDQFPPNVWVRQKINGNRADSHWLSYLIGTPRVTGCSWCVSIWVGGLGTLAFALYVALQLRQSWWPWPVWLLIWLASSSVTALIIERQDDV